MNSESMNSAPPAPNAACQWPPQAQPALLDDDIDLWWLPETVAMGSDRRSRIDSFLRGVLSAYVAVAALDLVFRRESKGKPFLDHSGSPDFNLSDTRGGSLLVVSARARVGVDLERIDRRPPALRLAERWFHPREYLALGDLPEVDRAPAFLRLWTAKESSCKATGTGIYGWLSKWVFDVASEAPLLRDLPAEAGDPSRWHFLRVEPAAGFTAVVTASGFRPRLRRLQTIQASNDATA